MNCSGSYWKNRVMISVVENAEHFHGQWIFFLKVNDMKSSNDISLINCTGVYPRLSYIIFFHEASLTMFLSPVFLTLGVIWC